MLKTELEQIQLIGLALQTKTTNAGGQAAIDCGNLWQAFINGNYADQVPGKLSNDIFAVYHAYEGDHTHPYSFFIGCKVHPGTPVPSGLNSLVIPAARYQKISAKGKMPDCVANAWSMIWQSAIHRAYQFDFEVYGEGSNDWNNAEVDIFIGVKE
ncbi:MAG: GyrI-like domain-containing protein [Chitinophagaceae bacterium]|nr:GyrI-like domain-containing protein [Chitinophagaceae bacterium]